jgi:hypothetical protein
LSDITYGNRSEQWTYIATQSGNNEPQNTFKAPNKIKRHKSKGPDVVIVNISIIILGKSRKKYKKYNYLIRETGKGPLYQGVLSC